MPVVVTRGFVRLTTLFDAGVCYSWLCKVDYLSPCSMPVFVTRGFVRLAVCTRGFVRLTTLVRGLI